MPNLPPGNPFAYGPPVKDPARFVGRAAELRRVFAALDTAHTGQLQSVSIVGPRRIGKSSLLYHLTQIYGQRVTQPERYVFVHADLEAAKYEQLDSLLKGLLNGLRDALPPDASALRQHLRDATNDRKLSLAEFETAIEQFSRLSASPLYPVICLDEFEQLVKHPNEFPDRVYDSWRSLMNASHLTLVIASARPLHELSQAQSLTSPFFNIFSEFITLGDLTDDEAWELIIRGQTCDQPFTEYDCLQALEIAGRHPLKLQLAGKLIYDAKAEPQINWKVLKREHRRIADQIFQVEKHGWKTKAKKMILALGGAVNEWLGRSRDDETSNWIRGWTAILAFVILIAIIVLGLWPIIIWKIFK